MYKMTQIAVDPLRKQMVHDDIPQERIDKAMSKNYNFCGDIIRRFLTPTEFENFVRVYFQNQKENSVGRKIKEVTPKEEALFDRIMDNSISDREAMNELGYKSKSALNIWIARICRYKASKNR